MANVAIHDLRAEIQKRYAGRVKPYADSDSDDAYGFTIDGIDATFSVIRTAASIAADRFDVQIESSPPGDYIFSGEFSRDQFLGLLNEFERPPNQWPVSN